MAPHPTIHASLSHRLGMLSIRDLIANDVPALTRYWASADSDFLANLGVDARRLGSARDIEQRFTALVEQPWGSPTRRGFAIDLDDRIVGYTNINCHRANYNVSHWHLIEPDARGRGISTALYPLRVATYFKLLPIELLVHETRVANGAMNAALNHFLPVAETRFLDQPDGLSLAGLFNIRYLWREDLPRICAVREGERLGGR